MKKDDFGNRMKEYENAFRDSLPRRLPVILRIDGCHFHTYTRGMKKPFDETLTNALWETCKYLAQNIMGCKIVYHQSDEISILLTNYDKLTTQSWFENNIQKMVSVSASMATAKFNEIIKKDYPDKALATFDSRAWVLPHDEVTNYFLWRQQDATKNSISMVAQANFPHNQLQGLTGKQLQDKLFLEKDINWNDLPAWQKRGVCITKQQYYKGNAIRSKWDVDHETPIFSQNRNYINQYVYRDKDE
ncbi:tRNA(His) guanylyltransferase Thg1 family protein [Paenibacillus sp. HWE-109]|uniref:tRNA(His) guanylyltransferase Thg1 family protein n=1 Tax=Paenibacillus sp. HWE-109 TaxID=1306526 RepID=UPI001EE0CFAE|nr:tRNA(His) guanylyltransferase Thg1 family protein [Paenibacillus sp. HWE-109]UKS28420.1 tRNA(His) guanylyltransferase Thg1 family protein [Paenibacillus sp. HWE-109]